MRLFSNTIPAVLAPLALGVLFATPTLAGSLVLSGTGVVRAAPDTATINTGVTSQAETAREALDANTAAMAELVTVLREAGLEDRDIQTSDFNVSPQYVYSDQRDEFGYSIPPEIRGYQVSNTVTITVRDLDGLGAVLDQAVTVGANTINGISFSVDDPTALEQQARRLAVADAIAKAETYAEAAGVTLGGIETISEGSQYAPPQPILRAQGMAMAESADVPVQAGELAFSITTTIGWAIGEDD